MHSLSFEPLSKYFFYLKLAPILLAINLKLKKVLLKKNVLNFEKKFVLFIAITDHTINK